MFAKTYPCLAGYLFFSVFHDFVVLLQVCQLCGGGGGGGGGTLGVRCLCSSVIIKLHFQWSHNDVARKHITHHMQLASAHMSTCTHTRTHACTRTHTQSHSTEFTTIMSVRFTFNPVTVLLYNYWSLETNNSSCTLDDRIYMNQLVHDIV